MKVANPDPDNKVLVSDNWYIVDFVSFLFLLFSGKPGSKLKLTFLP